MRKKPRYEVRAGRAIYRDGKFFFSITIPPYGSTEVSPCKGDELIPYHLRLAQSTGQTGDRHGLLGARD